MILLARFHIVMDGDRSAYLFVRKRGNELVYELTDKMLVQQPWPFDVGPPPAMAVDESWLCLLAVADWLGENGYIEQNSGSFRPGVISRISRSIAQAIPAPPPEPTPSPQSSEPIPFTPRPRGRPRKVHD